MPVLQTSSLSNQNITAALNVATYTADTERKVGFRLAVDQVAGNGDYVAYVKIQEGGAGSSYRYGPKTTLAAAAGETAIGFTSMPVHLNTGDVLTVWLLGLAGDTTTPDTKVIFFDAEQANITAIAANAITAASIAADAITDSEISTAAAQKIADVIFRRTMASIEASANGETLSVESLYGLIAAAFEASLASTTLTVRKSDGSTLGTKTLATDAAAVPVTGIT